MMLECVPTLRLSKIGQSSDSSNMRPVMRIKMPLLQFNVIMGSVHEPEESEDTGRKGFSVIRWLVLLLTELIAPHKT